MKKSLRKLNLSRETLRALESSALEQVAGQAEITTKPTILLTCPTNCDITYGC